MKGRRLRIAEDSRQDKVGKESRRWRMNCKLPGAAASERKRRVVMDENRAQIYYPQENPPIPISGLAHLHKKKGKN